MKHTTLKLLNDESEESSLLVHKAFASARDAALCLECLKVLPASGVAGHIECVGGLPAARIAYSKHKDDYAAIDVADHEKKMVKKISAADSSVAAKLRVKWLWQQFSNVAHTRCAWHTGRAHAAQTLPDAGEPYMDLTVYHNVVGMERSVAEYFMNVHAYMSMDAGDCFVQDFAFSDFSYAVLTSSNRVLGFIATLTPLAVTQLIDAQRSEKKRREMMGAVDGGNDVKRVGKIIMASNHREFPPAMNLSVDVFTKTGVEADFRACSWFSVMPGVDESVAAVNEMAGALWRALHTTPTAVMLAALAYEMRVKSTTFSTTTHGVLDFVSGRDTAHAYRDYTRSGQYYACLVYFADRVLRLVYGCGDGDGDDDDDDDNFKSNAPTAKKTLSISDVAALGFTTGAARDTHEFLRDVLDAFETSADGEQTLRYASMAQLYEAHDDVISRYEDAMDSEGAPAGAADVDSHLDDKQKRVAAFLCTVRPFIAKILRTPVQAKADTYKSA